MKLLKLPRLWYTFAHRHLCALQWAIEERGEGSHYPPQEHPISVSPSVLLSHFLIFLRRLPVFALSLSLPPVSLSSPRATAPHLSLFPPFLFLSSSWATLLSHAAVYHSLYTSSLSLSAVTVSIPSPFICPSAFVQSLKWIPLMGPACNRAGPRRFICTSMQMKRHIWSVQTCMYAYFEQPCKNVLNLKHAPRNLWTCQVQ